MSLHVVESGRTDPDAPVVVLVHGALDRSSGMARVARVLDDRAHVVRYDRRGYGRSRPHPGPFTVSANCDDLVALVEPWRCDRARRRVLLVGHSIGSHVVLGVAARRPDLLDAAVVYEPPLSWEPWWPGSTGGSFALGQRDPQDAAEAFMRRMVGDRVWERLPAATREARRAEGVPFLGEITDLRRGEPWPPLGVLAPVVVGYGTASADHQQRGAQVLAARLRHGTTVALEGCGHGAHTSAARSFAEALVLGPLARLDQDPGRSTVTS